MNNILDEYARLIVLAYFWPFFVAGNIDNWKELAQFKHLRKN